MADDTGDGSNPFETGPPQNGNVVSLASAEARSKRQSKAEKRKANGLDKPWHDQLIEDGRGGFKPALANAITALEQAPEWRELLSFDQFAMRVRLARSTPWGTASELGWTDTDDIKLANWLQREGIMVDPRTASNAVQAVSHSRKFHPVHDYLKSLTWDGTPRIHQWLTYYFGVPLTTYSEAIGRRWLISAVARIAKPGVQADHCLVLEGPQGKLKSTALRILADPWFTDDLAALNSKDAAMQVAGVWIVEIAELDRMSSNEVADIKAFLTRRIDRFRPPYGRGIVDRPRESIFAATVNQQSYLKDETGGRRFWPVTVQSIDDKGLRNDRDQLWAEAIHAFKAGEPWWLETQELRDTAAEEAEQRYVMDSWEPSIQKAVELRTSITVPEIYDALDIRITNRDQKSDNRIAKIVKRLGWIKKKVRVGTRFEWRYENPSK